MQQTKIYYTYEAGKDMLHSPVVSSMIWERLDLYSILLSKMYSSSMIQKVLVLTL